MADLTTLKLINDSGTTQAAGAVTRMFGQTFVQGQVPSGTYPTFHLPNGTACPATLGRINSHPDGSMKFCAAELILPTSVAGGATLVVTVRNGGSAPAASTRTLAEVSALDIKVELNITDPAEGLFTASLNAAITAATDIVVLESGPAAKVWRIGGAPTNSGGTPHPQFYVWHYVVALSNADGSLQGFRYMGRIALPWVDVATNARMRDHTITLKRGATTVRSMVGHSTSETVRTSTIRTAHYGSDFTAGPDAMYDYFQGGGSNATDSTLRIVPSITQMQNSRFVPPVSRAGTPTSSAADYYPGGNGLMMWYMPNTGGRPDIGLVTGWCCNYMANPGAAVNERALRVNALAAGGWRICSRRFSTKNIVAVADMRASYNGLGAIQSGWRNHPDYANGFVQGSPNTPLLWAEDTAHRPAAFLVAYAVTGEPHLLDLGIDNAAALAGTVAPGIKTMVTSRPTGIPNTSWQGDRDAQVGGGPVIKGGGLAFIPGRTGAWPTRDMAFAANMVPDVMPDGSDANVYLKDIVNATMAAVVSYATLMPTQHRTDGLWIFQENGGQDRDYESPWQLAFWNMALCYISGVWHTDANAVAARRYHLLRYTRAHEEFGIEMMASYRMAQFDHNEHMILSISDYVGSMDVPISMSSATNRVTITGTGNKWTPTNGDVFAFSPQNTSGGNPNDPLPGLGRNRRLYTVNASGNTFQLALTPGGSAITLPDYNLNLYQAQLQNTDLAFWPAPGSDYPISNVGILSYHKYLGDTDAQPLLTYVKPKLAAAGFDPNGSMHQHFFQEAPLTSEPGDPATPTAPSITAQPQNKTVNDGESTTIPCSFSGTAPVSAQFQTQAPGGGAWSNVGSPVSVSPASVSTGTRTLADNGRKYRWNLGNSVQAGVLSNEVTLTVTAGAADTTSPVIPGTVSLSNLTHNSYTTGCDAAADAVGVTAYQVSQNGGSTWIDKGTARTHSHFGRTPGATDQVQWRARDGAGNWSVPITRAVILSAAPTDSTTPTRPSIRQVIRLLKMAAKRQL